MINRIRNFSLEETNNLHTFYHKEFISFPSDYRIQHQTSVAICNRLDRKLTASLDSCQLN